MHLWSANTWMQYSSSRAATMTLLLFLEVISGHKIFWGSMPPHPPIVVQAYASIHAHHATPL